MPTAAELGRQLGEQIGRRAVAQLDAREISRADIARVAKVMSDQVLAVEAELLAEGCAVQEVSAFVDSAVARCRQIIAAYRHGLLSTKGEAQQRVEPA
jgi:hypothetical protein